uniref:BHLH domain-containing protein n=2 Tax=Photinus pyralis TaxID=7054 RepID=A0A1Y1N681_PHOPY
MFTIAKRGVGTKEQRGTEAIHSGHFMISHFEAEEQDDDDELAVPIPEPEVNELRDMYRQDHSGFEIPDVASKKTFSQQPLTIDTSLAKLFQCMSIAYRQKLTSPKWNRFRGIRLRWKDKIRLNNVIWRCWHMQFIKRVNTYICQFASPLDVDTHNKPEAIVLEGKYWKRKLAAVTAEYKKWRMFHRTHVLGHALKESMDTLSELDALVWHSQSSDSMHMMVDEDYLGLMSDTLFSTITSQPFVFPDSREIAKAGLADFIQPSLGPLQPSLEDYMDTFEPLQDLITSKLPTVPEENGSDPLYRHTSSSWCYTDLDLMSTNSMQINTLTNTSPALEQYNSVPPVTLEKQETHTQQLQSYPNDVMIHPVEVYAAQQQQSSYPIEVKTEKSIKKLNQMPITSVYNRSSDNTMYQNYGVPDVCAIDNRMQLSPQQTFKLPQSSSASQSTSRGYKFSSPASTTPNLKFSSQNSSNFKATSRPHQNTASSLIASGSTIDSALLPEIKTENRIRSTHKSDRRRSSSVSRETVKRPPLLSAMSDPQLVTPANSMLLTQLLTNSAPNNLFAPSHNLSDPLSLQGTSIHIKEENASMSIVSQAQTATLLITPLSMNSSQSSISDSIILTSLTPSNSPSPGSSQGIGSCPTSPQGALRSSTPDSVHKDQRRVGHIHAEQKRRYNIKNGFDVIHSLIPHLNQNPNAKLSKAAMLQKGAEYIRQLQQERSQLKDEMDSLRQQIESLNTSISNCQSLLPATGAPVSRRRDSKMQEMFDDYVQKRTMEDWKFWIVSFFNFSQIDRDIQYLLVNTTISLFKSAHMFSHMVPIRDLINHYI